MTSLSLPRWEPESLEGGAMVELSHGSTWYRTSGHPLASADSIVIFFHGVSWFSFSFDGLAPVAADLVPGATVVVFDGYGRGRSATPDDVNYTPELFADQARELLEAIGAWGKPVHVIGHSLGGGNAAHFAAAHTDVVASVVLLTPAGVATNIPFLGKLLTLPFLGWAVMSLAGRALLLDNLHKKRCRDDFNAADDMPELIDAIVERMEWCIAEKPGWVMAFHNTMCHYPMSGAAAPYRALQAAGIKTTVVLAGADYVMDIPECQRLIVSWAPSAAVVVLDGASHSIHMEDEDRVVAVLRDHFA
ncbi:hydrolase [Thecamonas trahens ATCC 50062]|uniref:Hydrolase n=1 Tax=Thecamonas trahens ATCC 50062 TaxID=461836 RepID=A0A0L0D3X7_THETB|nr:hydrolase [Thecamonas trahens ATCC 50062]KNC47029.1 hydrolase [Thecamonas trahens ATCC 50062]|eukprot:XP_013759809.1 hydrolase [Thecamonas trahens ATCC 50062]